MSGGEGSFKGVLEGDEVERFMAQFVVSDAERAAMLRADPKANVAALPKETAQVLHDIRQIWDEKGFQSPNDLKAMLIDKYLPQADPRLKDYIHQIESAHGTPETTTGYMGKEHAYVATGLAHLYAKETNRPIAMVEADFSNMGGTNTHFTDLLNKEGVVTGDAAARQGMHMTDQAVGLLCKSLTTDLANELPKGAKIVPIRTGGDEIRILITGVEDRKELTRLTALMHANVETHVAAMGLQDHAHLKAKDDPVRNGFGVALTTEDMRDIKNTDRLVQELDARISDEKRQIGLTRLGQVDEQQAREALQQKIARGDIKVPEGQTAEQVIAARLEERKAQAAAAAQDLHDQNPMHNKTLEGGSAGFNKYVETASKELTGVDLSARPLPGVLSPPEPIGGRRPDGVEPFSSLEDRWNAKAVQHLEGEGVKLSPADRFMLKLSINGMAAQDPSAQTFMPKIVGPTVEAYAAETKEFRQTVDPANTDVRAAMNRAGLHTVNDITPQAMAVSFHNLAGLNSALGHHQADMVLRAMSGDIIEKSLAEAGIPTSGEKKPYAIAHHGGGNFSVMIQPGGVDANGKPWFAGPDTIKQVQEQIKQRTAALNDMKVADFLESKGVTVTDDMRKTMPATFADVQDPKVRETGAIKGRVNGLEVESATAPMILRQQRDGAQAEGFGFMGRVRKEADAKLDAHRNTILLTKAVEAGISAQIELKDKKPPGRKGPKNGGGEGGGGTPVPPKQNPPNTPPAGGAGTPRADSGGGPRADSKFTPPPANNTPAPNNPPAGNTGAQPQAKAPATLTAAEKPPVEKPAVEKPGAGTGAKVQGHAATAVGMAQVGVDIMQGKYGQALQSSATQVALNPNTYKAASTLAKEGGAVAKSLGFLGKKIPVIGAFVTAGFVLYEVGHNIYDGNYGRAASAAGAGTAEALGNIVGFGVGDLAREGVRETIVHTAGEQYAPDKSGIRTLAETAYEAGSKFMKDGAPKTTGQLAQNKPPQGPKPNKPPTMG